MPPCRKVIGSDEVDCVVDPVNPDMVIVGEHHDIRGTVLNTITVIELFAHGKGEL